MPTNFHNGNFMILGALGPLGQALGPKKLENRGFPFFQKRCAAEFGAGGTDRQPEISVLEPNRDFLDIWRFWTSVVVADRRSVVFADMKSVVSADKKSVVSADKKSVVCQDIPMVWTTQGAAAFGGRPLCGQ